MAAAFRLGWSNSTPASPLSIATSTVAHDVLVLYTVFDNSSGTVTPPTGFTQQATLSSTFDGQTLVVQTKPDATGSEGTIAVSSNSIMIGGILALSGVNNTTPLNVAAVTATTSTGQASPWTQSASITPTVNGCLIVAITGDDVGASFDVTHSIATTAGTTGTWTTNQDLNSGFYNTAAFSCVQTTAGAITVTVTGTAASQTAGRSLVLMAFAPAAGGGITSAMAESVTSTDAPASSMSPSQAQAETVVSADMPASSMSAAASASESITAADSQNGVVVVPVAQTEAVSSSDTQASAMSANAAQAESISAADSASLSAAMSAVQAEAVTTAESASLSASMAAAQYESVSLAEATDGTVTTVGTYQGAIAESIAAADSTSSTASMDTAQGESLVLVDSVVVPGSQSAPDQATPGYVKRKRKRGERGEYDFLNDYLTPPEPEPEVLPEPEPFEPVLAQKLRAIVAPQTNAQSIKEGQSEGQAQARRFVDQLRADHEIRRAQMQREAAERQRMQDEEDEHIAALLLL